MIFKCYAYKTRKNGSLDPKAFKKIIHKIKHIKQIRQIVKILN